MAEFQWRDGSPGAWSYDSYNTAYCEGELWDGEIGVTIQIRPPSDKGDWEWIAWPPDGLMVGRVELQRVTDTDVCRNLAIRAAKLAARRILKLVKGATTNAHA